MPRGTGHDRAVGRLTLPGLVTLALVVMPGRGLAADAWAPGPSRGPVTLDRNSNGVWIVTATLNGNFRGRFLLDTGATWCAVTPRTAARLRLSQVGRNVEMRTAGGVVPMPAVRLRTVAVGAHRASDVQAVILPDGVGDELDGLIGMNFLNQFSYAIDPRRRLLRLD